MTGEFVGKLILLGFPLTIIGLLVTAAGLLLPRDMGGMLAPGLIVLAAGALVLGLARFLSRRLLERELGER